jgi:hypothetical protein
VVVEFFGDVVGEGAAIFIWALFLLDDISAHFSAIIATDASSVF